MWESEKVHPPPPQGTGGGKEEVSQAARGQLIVSGNVFHLHVYTVNNGGGLSAAPFSAAIPIRVANCVQPSTSDGFFCAENCFTARPR